MEEISRLILTIVLPQTFHCTNLVLPDVGKQLIFYFLSIKYLQKSEIHLHFSCLILKCDTPSLKLIHLK